MSPTPVRPVSVPWIQVIHGDGMLAWCARVVLLPLTGLYALVVAVRNALYDAGLVRACKVDVPVVSVGNLTVGGTGKTPLVVALACLGAARGRKVAIVSRGYGAEADGQGRSDEVALLAARCPEASLFVGANKVAGARRAVAEGADLVLLDDGMQSRRLQRDLDIVVIDARRPFSNGWLLPAGALREPPAALGRAGLVVLTHHEDVDVDVVDARVRAYHRSVPIVRARHEAVAVRGVDGGRPRPPEALADREVFLFCGVASPEGFRSTVERLGARVTGLMAFGDHHAFRPADLARVRAAARTAQLVCTEKDAAKVASIPGHDDVWCLVIALKLQDVLPPLPGIDV